MFVILGLIIVFIIQNGFVRYIRQFTKYRDFDGLLFMLFFSFFSAFIEELLFRHSLPMLFFSTFTCSILFGLTHAINYFLITPDFKAILVQVICTIMLGHLLTYLSIYQAIIAHMIYNITGMSLAFFIEVLKPKKEEYITIITCYLEDYYTTSEKRLNVKLINKELKQELDLKMELWNTYLTENQFT